MVLKLKVSGRIARPVAEVFEAVADPAKLSQFFATGPGGKSFLERENCTVSAPVERIFSCGITLMVNRQSSIPKLLKCPRTLSFRDFAAS